MTDEELREALDGLFAYDRGSVDSGIHDEALRARCVAELEARKSVGAEEWRRLLAVLVRDMWLSDKAIAQGYGTEDAVSFVEWLEERMDCFAGA
jgi:hypothetical protein